MLRSQTAPRPDGEHGSEGTVEFVADEGGFVEDEHGDGGEATGGVFHVCYADEARAIGQQYGVAICAVAARSYFEPAEKCFRFSDKFAALPFGGARDEDERFAGLCRPGRRLWPRRRWTCPTGASS